MGRLFDIHPKGDKMKRVVLVLILLQLSLALFAAIPSSFSSSGNPELYNLLRPKAKDNLKSLPSAQSKAFHKLLKQNDDILMAYLIAYESNANLAQADPEDLYSNYRELRVFLDKEGSHYMPEFFLSYVAKQTVSDERISAYRRAMLDDGLREVWENNANILDRYRATASWCVEKLKFQQTSGRDLSPLDITQKTLLGRCEEMQILFVAAARTVGIPARPASTPWWAHIDNNHAWAEVYLEDEWAYTGDMDAAYHPNQTWFSGLIDKTVLILADGSMPTAQDEILAEGSYELQINSTRNYAKERTRDIEVQVLDQDGQAVPKAAVSVLVFNWGALRTLTTLSSDEEGKLKFSAGRGAFYLSAFKDGRQALSLVPSNEQSKVELSLVLSEQSFAPQNAVLNYPANKMEWKQASQSYQDDINVRKEIWQEQVDTWLAEATAQAPQDSLAQQVLIASRGNYPELQKFLSKVGVPQKDFMQFLLSSDPKFLWQADARQLEAVYQHFRMYPRETDYPSELYQPTMFYEELSHPFKMKGSWSLYPSSLIHKGFDDTATLLSVMKSLHKKYKINGKKALAGLLRLDVAVKQKYLSNYQFRMLAISALRASGLAADYTRVPDMILVYLNEDWQYYDAINRRFAEQNEVSSSHSLKLSIVDIEGLPLKIAEEQMSLTRLVKGQFYGLNNRFEYMGNGKYQSLIKDTDAYLQFGYRISDSQTAVQILPLRDWDFAQEITLTAPDYPKTWQEAEESLLALFDSDTLEHESLILLGNHDQENSLRILELIKDLPYRFFGYATSPAPLPQYSVLPSWQELSMQNGANLHRSLTFFKKDGIWLYYEGRWEKLPQ